MDSNKQKTLNRMFEHACAFYDCAIAFEIEPNTIECRVKSHTVSGIVNSAFSCEIYLKSLLYYYDVPLSKFKNKDGHELKKLWHDFKGKDNENASFIEGNIRRWFNSENIELFDKLLEEASNAFEYWRYIYEKDSGSININFLRGFRLSLRNLCCKTFYNMTWEEYKNKE